MSRLLEGGATHLSTQTFGTVAYQPAELLRDGKLSPAADGASLEHLGYDGLELGFVHHGSPARGDPVDGKLSLAADNAFLEGIGLGRHSLPPSSGAPMRALVCRRKMLFPRENMDSGW